MKTVTTQRFVHRTWTGALCVFTLAAMAFPMWAHHAFAAEFDANKPVKLQGVVTKMDWINPHSWIHIDVKDADGKVVSWMIECGSPNTLFRKGLTKDSLPAGISIVVDGYMAKDGGGLSWNIHF